MKTAVIISDGVKQIMLTPENDSEKFALGMISTNDNISVEFKSGTLYDGKSPESAKGYTVSKCQGGYLRAFESAESLMLVLTPKEIKE